MAVAEPEAAVVVEEEVEVAVAVLAVAEVEETGMIIHAAVVAAMIDVTEVAEEEIGGNVL